MRILMLSQFYPPIQGGEEQYVRMLSRELAAAGHEVTVATIWHAGLPEFEVQQGVRIYRIRGSMQRLAWLFSEAGRQHAPPFPDPELMWALQRVVRQTRPQVVHAHNWLGYQFLPLKTINGAKLVLTMHDMSLVCAKKSYMYHDAPCSGPGPAKCLGCAMDHYGPAKGVVTLLGNTAMAAAERLAIDMFLPVSHAVATETGLMDSGYPYQVIPGFLPDDITVLRDDYSAYLSQLPAEDYLLFVGGFRRIKGVDVLLQAYAELTDAPPLVLIGYEASDTPTTFPPGVVILKNWPHGAVMAAWQRSLLGVVPSVCQEAFPLVTLEAMSSGRPVIGSRIGGIPEGIVDGQTGLLVPPGDPVALRGALERLLNEPGLRERMGQAAKQRAAEFRASVIVPRIEAIYHQLVEPSTSRVTVYPERQKEQLG